MRHTLWLALAFACKGPVAPFETDTDTDSVPAVETACDDEVDDDLDGLVDCADDDCSAELLCTWPGAVNFQSIVFFDANNLAKLGGYPDCTVETTSTLQRDRAESCPDCDRVFCGDFAYPQDSCPTDPNFPRPASGCFGFSFDTDTEWTMYGRNPDTDMWDQVGVLSGTGPLQWTSNTPVDFEGTDVGDLTTTFYVSPL